MKKLLTSYGFNSNSEYYKHCVKAYMENFKEEAKVLFKKLPIKNRKEMIIYFLPHNLELTIPIEAIYFFISL